MKIMVCCIILLVNLSYAREAVLSEKMFQTKSFFEMTRGNIGDLCSLNMLAESGSSCKMPLYGDKFSGRFLILQKAVPIDRINFQSLIDTESNTYRVESLLIVLLTNTEETNIENNIQEKDAQVVYTTNIELSDQDGLQGLNLPNAIQADCIYIQPVSVFFDGVNTNHINARIGGLAVYNGPEKMEFSNISNQITRWKNEKIRQICDVISNNYTIIHELIYDQDVKQFFNDWEQNNGVLTDQILWKPLKNGFKLHIQFTVSEKDPANGKILIGMKDGAIDYKDPLNHKKRFVFKKALELGEWKLDNNGVLWIKIGVGTWKASTGTLFSFDETDLGGWQSVTVFQN